VSSSPPRLFEGLAPVMTELRTSPAPRTPESEIGLAELLYVRCHGRGDQFPDGARSAEGDEIKDFEFLARLSDANSGLGPVHSDWTVSAIEDETRFAVELDGLTLWIDRPAPAAVGQRVPVRLPKEYRNLYPGHYVLIGDSDDGALNDSVRLYWNLETAGAEALVRCASEILNRARVPFRLKVLSNAAAFTRADAAIMYLPRSHRTAGALAIRDLYGELRGLMRAPVSHFALPLAPGLALAEDPVDGSSFGVHRSRLLAPLLFDARHESEPLTAIGKALEAQGYEPGNFYRNPGSPETYPEFLIDVD